MGDVNFLAKEKKDDLNQTQDSKVKKEEIKWSEVKPANQENDKDKKVKNSINDADISTWLKSLKDDKEEGKGVKELKNSKEALAEYKEVFRKTKKAAELKEGLEKIKETGEIKEKNEGGIAEIIKSKLSFGGGKKIETTLKTNLIKSEGVTFFDWKEKTKVFVINLFLAILILGTAYGYLDYKEKGISKKSETLVSVIDKMKTEIEILEKDVKEVDRFQKKVKIVSDLLAKHIYWTNFFNFLESNLLADIYLDSSFEGRTDGFFNLVSKGKNFSNLTDQSRLLRQKEEVLNISIESGEMKAAETEKEQEVLFSIKLEVNPSIFYK